MTDVTDEGPHPATTPMEPYNRGIAFEHIDHGREGNSFRDEVRLLVDGEERARWNVLLRAGCEYAGRADGARSMSADITPEDIRWKGRPITELTREELIEAMAWLYVGHLLAITPTCAVQVPMPLEPARTAR